MHLHYAFVASLCHQCYVHCTLCVCVTGNNRHRLLVKDDVFGRPNGIIFYFFMVPTVRGSQGKLEG